ncbi:MAG: preprotein translocase subunit SecG [Sedimentisphaerales bacterium]|nr:preprotein translocase subunit SecG [Sedimentisphaerales bacterium]
MNFILANTDIPWWAQTLAVIFIIICLALILLVLLQKGRGGGLAAAFGGAGGQSAFGSKTGDVFTWVTIVAVAMFLLLAMVLTRSYKPGTPTEYGPSAVPTASAPANNAAAPLTDGGETPTAATVAPETTTAPATAPAALPENAPQPPADTQ